MRIGILEPFNFSKKAIEILKGFGDVAIYQGSDLDSFLADKEILFIRLKHFLGQEFFDKAKALKLVCSPTTGLNHIDLNEAKKRNIRIISLKGEEDFLSNIRATPEHTIGLIIGLLRNYKGCFQYQANWDRDKFVGEELYRNTVGIIGLGRVGRILVQYLKSFDAEVYFYDKDKRVVDDYAKKMTSLGELIKTARIIVLCSSYEKENDGFINREMIDLMRDRFFVNTSRGENVDEDYLIEKIKANHFKGVGLDVIRDECEENNLDKIREIDAGINFILTPHVGGATKSSMERTEEHVCGLLKKVI